MSLQLLNEFIQRYNERVIEEKYVNWQRIKQSYKWKEYRNIAVNGYEYNDYVKAGYLDGYIKTLERGTNIAYVKKSNLDGLLAYLKKLECEYIPDGDVLPLIGFEKNTSLKRFASSSRKSYYNALLSLCNSEGIEYIQFDPSLNGGIFYLKRDQFNHFLDTHMHRAEVSRKFNLTDDDIDFFVKQNNVEERIFSPYKARFFLKEDAEKYFTNVPKEEWLSWIQIGQNDKYEIKSIVRDEREFNDYIQAGYLDGYVMPADKGQKARMIGYVKKNSLEGFLEYMSRLEYEYIGDKEFLRLLGWKQIYFKMNKKNKESVRKTVSALCDSEGIEYIYFDIPLKGSIIFLKREPLNNFLNIHITSTEAQKKYGLTGKQLKNIAIKNGIEEKVFHRTICRFFLMEDFNLSDIDFIKIELRNRIEESKRSKGEKDHPVGLKVNIYGEQKIVYSTSDVCEILKLNPTYFSSFCKKVNLISFNSVRSYKFYLKSDIDKIKEEMKYLKKKYCTFEEAIEMLGTSYNYKNKIGEPVKPTELMKIVLGKNKRIYLREEVKANAEEYKKQKAEQEQLVLAYENDPLEAFYKVIEIKSISFFEKSKVTEREWFSFCEQRLPNYRGTYRNKRDTSVRYVKATEKLAEFTMEKELYSYTSKELELKFFKTASNWGVQKLLWDFFKVFEEKMKYYSDKKGKDVRIYELSKISKASPYLRKKKHQNSKVKEIYSYNEFKALYAFAQDMNHKYKAILDAEKIVNGESGVSNYASAWLFLLVHLTNAWRQPDILQIPELDLEKIGVFSLDTLKERDLLSGEINKVIDQLCSETYTISKTLVEHQFFCADDLKLPVATAAVICTIISRQTTGVTGVPIINFRTKDNKFGAGYRSYETFFKNINKLENLEDFCFQSQKMNRTLLVITYIVLVQKGKGSAAFKIAQKLRSHISIESTNIYMLIPQEEMDRICITIFNRRMFGYIPGLLAEILFGETENYDDKTKEIIKLNEKFGDIYKIEATTGYINKVLAERESVAKYILELGIDGAIDLMFDLSAGLLPSKEKNFQCIISTEECSYPERSCKQCHLSVPNFYTLSAMAKSIEAALLNFLNNYSPECYEGEKTFLFNILFVQLDNLERACQKFGTDEVMNFFEGGKDYYNELIVKVLLSEEDIAEDKDKYMTYRPVYIQ